MREEIEAVLPFVEKWVLATGATYISTPKGIVIWSSDYTEYWLRLGDADQPEFLAINLEIKRFLIFLVPVTTEDNFLKLMELLNQPASSTGMK